MPAGGDDETQFFLPIDETVLARGRLHTTSRRNPRPSPFMTLIIGRKIIRKTRVGVVTSIATVSGNWERQRLRRQLTEDHVQEGDG